MICIVTGSRDFENEFKFTEFINKSIVEFQYKRPFSLRNLTVIHGGARGTDFLASSWYKRYAPKYGFKDIKVFPAQWDKINRDSVVGYNVYHGGAYNKLAGFERNQRMIEYATKNPKEGAFLVAVLFGQSKGTKDCIKRAMDAGIDVFTMRVNRRL